MIATLQNKMETVSSSDINKTLKLVTRYAWVGTGMLFLCYSYFVGAITFKVISQEALQQANKTLISSMGDQEQAYLQKQVQLNESYASSIGLVKGTAVAFAVAKPAVAWNVGQ